MNNLIEFATKISEVPFSVFMVILLRIEAARVS